VLQARDTVADQFPSRCREVESFHGLGACWLGREGSNLRMAESKSGATAFDFNDYSELS
jgi:hypothetical protein